MVKINPSEITPEAVYRSRRKFMQGIGALTGAALLAACGVSPEAAPTTTPGSSTLAAETPLAQKDELGDPFTPYQAVTTYNNFYEFTMDKEGVAPLSKDFKTSPWTVAVGGLVNKPKT
jgi:sulfoxide reductase catalytic subunit YedY